MVKQAQGGRWEQTGVVRCRIGTGFGRERQASGKPQLPEPRKLPGR